ncbi:hypothetical protein BDV41DRAFT_578847 [Aspergillus transmontanensis]|uniref:Uncharacterized protein n=1 Tax=Aspergillus transmontanensis TaxID=1034304 RepID=A0A5N6VRL5_9EURO|nr:hypothetical protein BDV41DRAFT_578847 [Aspergillus transmontanensis]
MAEKEKKEKEKEMQAEYEIERLSLTGLQAHILYHGLEKTHCFGAGNFHLDPPFYMETWDLYMDAVQFARRNAESPISLCMASSQTDISGILYVFIINWKAKQGTRLER